jgi:ABC-type oligopeptide transport system ATPase subunit
MGIRTFSDKPAVRTSVPLLLGLTGASGSGKTYSALRAATGIQRVTGGDIYYIDTEARRALHYADRFKFRHLEFQAPFGPLDYLAAIEHCQKKGAKVIVVDSMSHEHEGPGGVLEKHEQETTRLSALWHVSRDAAQMSAWAEPKAERRRLINSILQLGINGIFCFRAKEKLKIIKGEKPQPMGWMPIAGEEFVYEMTVNCLLYPGCGGVPEWNPGEIGEKMMVKLPEQFRELFKQKRPMDEDTGESLAKWAAGDVQPEKKRDPIAGLTTLLSLGQWPDAEKRVLTAYKKNHRSEFVETDLDQLSRDYKAVKNDGSEFDKRFPRNEGTK